jgi:hypothetical protein
MKEQEKSSDQNSKAEGYIPFTQLAAYGAGGIIPIALFNIAGILVGLMGNISLGLSAFWLGYGMQFPILSLVIFRITPAPVGEEGALFYSWAEYWFQLLL